MLSWHLLSHPLKKKTKQQLLMLTCDISVWQRNWTCILIQSDPRLTKASISRSCARWKGETYWRDNGAQQLPAITDINLISPAEILDVWLHPLLFGLLPWLKRRYQCASPRTFTFVYFCMGRAEVTAGSEGTRPWWISPSAANLTRALVVRKCW